MQKKVRWHASVGLAVNDRFAASRRARAKWQPKERLHQLARSTWRRTASQLQEEQALKPDRTVDQRLADEGVTLPPSTVDGTEQVKVLRLRRDQIDTSHLLPDTIYCVKRKSNGDLQMLLQVQARA